MLRYSEAERLRETLQALEIDGSFIVDQRLNALVVRATAEAMATVEALLQTVDVANPSPTESTDLLRDELDGLPGGLEIVVKFAELSGVTVAHDKDSGIMMLRGTEKDISKVHAFIDQLKTVYDADEPALQSSSYVLRTLWLCNAPDAFRDGESPSEHGGAPDEALQRSIEKLAELGFPNMKVVMQLVGRCDVNERRARCQLDGSLTHPQGEHLLECEAILEIGNENAIRGEIALDASIAGTSANSSVRVSINMVPQKYYVLSAAPIGGYQSAFVVQLIGGM
ncbi:MAG: hypothetical protein KDB22_23920 [Planctomycetales bacterium]|nr:hypothetical protein [Planctomycetales bacterium]